MVYFLFSGSFGFDYLFDIIDENVSLMMSIVEGDVSSRGMYRR